MVDVTFSLWEADTINTEADTYVVTHGYMSSSSQEWVGELAGEIAEQDPFANIILTDWSDGADSLNYFNAVADTVEVGEQLAYYLVDSGVDPDTTQLIGHSLGAHVSGIAGDVYDDITGMPINTIVGLDPAGPAYESTWFSRGKSTEERLDPTDGNRVVAFHTSSTFGYDDPLGLLDLYINPDDWFQPGQRSSVGNHGYAHELYTDLIDGYGYVQSDSQALGDGIFDYGDIFTFSGSIDVETTEYAYVG